MFTALLLAAVLAGPAFGQPQTPQRVGVGITELRLALRDALEMALKNNLEIEVERTNRALAAQRLKGAFGAFDPILRWRPVLESRNTPAASVLQGPGGKLTEGFHVQNFNFLQRLPNRGAALKVDFDNTRSSTTNPFVNLNPLYSSRLAVSFTQPLMRNRLIDAERAEIRIRRKQHDMTDTEFELKTIDILLQVETVYWDLVAVRQDIEVEADGVGLAEELLARNQRMIASGVLAPVELAASRAELERRKDTWYRSIALLTDVENRLKLLLAPDRTADLWSDIIVPTDRTTAAPPEVIDLKSTVVDAIKKRPESRMLAQQLDVNVTQKKLAKEQTKPLVSFIAGYANTGMGGPVRPGENPLSSINAPLYQRVNQLSAYLNLSPLAPSSFGGTPDFLIGGYGSNLSNLFSGRYQTLQAGLEFDLNLRNRGPESAFQQTIIGERRIKLEQTRLEQGIEAQVRGSLQLLDSARQRITASDASAEAAKERLDSESRLFQTGESTNFLVLTRQNELLESRRRAVLARLDFNKAIARLVQALGKTLDTHNILLK